MTSRVDRVAVAILAVGATGLNLLFSTTLFDIEPGPTGLYGGLALATMTTVVIVRRWLVAPVRARRELLPVLVAGLVFLGVLIINLVRRIADVPDDVAAVLIAARDLAPAAIPVALLIGFYRQSERRLQAVVDAIPDRMVRFDRAGAYLPDASEPVADDAGVPQAGGSTMRCSRSRASRPSVRPPTRSTRVASGPTTSPSNCPAGRRELEARVPRAARTR